MKSNSYEIEAKAEHRVKSRALEPEQFQVGPTGPHAHYLNFLRYSFLVSRVETIVPTSWGYGKKMKCKYL